MIKLVIIDIFKRYMIDKMLSSNSGFEVIGSCDDNYEAIRLIDSKKPDVVVLNSCLKNNEAGEIIPLIKSKTPKTGIVLVIAGKDEEYISRAIAFGVSAYLLEGDMDALCYAVKEVHRGGCFMGVHAAAKILPLFSTMAASGLHLTRGKPQALPKSLSRIELSIMILVTKGFLTSEIARKLNVTAGTVRNYISSIMRKIGVQNRNQISIFVIRNSLFVFDEKDG
jgi:DNA-binding NarL/FixJ family response regulator